MNRKNLFNVVIIILLSQVVAQLLVFKGNLLIDGGDIFFPLSPTLETHRSAFLWDERYATGIYNPRQISYLFPFLALLLLFEKFGLSLVISQRILLGIAFSMSGFSMYYLTITLFNISKKNEHYKYFAGFVSSSFYMFNQYTLTIWAAPYFQYLCAYIFSPLLLAFCIKGLTIRNLKYAVLIPVVSLFFTSMASNPTFVAVMMLPTLLYLFYYMVLGLLRKKYRNVLYAVIFSAAVLAIYTGVNSGWILPMMWEISEAKTEVVTVWNLLSWLQWKSSYSSILNVIRLISFDGWWGGFKGMPCFAYSSSYITNPLLIAASLMFPIIAFTSILLKKDRYVIFFSILVIIGTFLTKGIHQPLGWINQWLYFNLPTFWIFRSVERFLAIIVLSYSYLIGVSVSSLYAWGRSEGTVSLNQNLKICKRILITSLTFFIILLIIAYPWPFWAGNVVHSGEEGGEIGYPYHINVPPYYYNTAKWINSQSEDFRILSVPFKGPYVQYTWGYGGGDISLRLFRKPIIDAGYGSTYTRLMSSTVYSHLRNNLTEQIGNVLGLMNIKYVLLHHDTDWQFYDQPSPDVLKQILEQQRGLHLDEHYGELAFYVVDDEYFLPHIYACP